MTESQEQVLHNLRERVKELTALHGTARFLQNHARQSVDILADIANLLPPAWQYPEITGARISFRDLAVTTPLFRETAWMQVARFMTSGGESGAIEVCYLEERPLLAEGPFLKEERDLINSLAEMLRSHFQHKLADEALLRARESLEQQVIERTMQLRQLNEELRDQVRQLQEANRRIEEYQRKLQRLALELSLAEVRERQEISADLHDHIGQALAFIKLQISQFQSNATFCGFENSISDIITLLDRTIAYTRNLTLQISPPVLHEFGLAAAIEWLADQFRQDHKLNVTVDRSRYYGMAKGEHAAVLFRAVKELLTNAARHANADQVAVSISGVETQIAVRVVDNGCGFDVQGWQDNIVSSGKYGLFSIRERIRLLGGDMTVASTPGGGTEIILTAPLPQK